MENISFPKNNVFYALGGIFSLIIFCFLFLSAPFNFPSEATIRVEKGSSLRSVSSMLKKEHIIRSKTAFEFFVILYGKEKNIISAGISIRREAAIKVRKGILLSPAP